MLSTAFRRASPSSSSVRGSPQRRASSPTGHGAFRTHRAAVLELTHLVIVEDAPGSGGSIIATTANSTSVQLWCITADSEFLIDSIDVLHHGVGRAPRTPPAGPAAAISVLTTYVDRSGMYVAAATTCGSLGVVEVAVNPARKGLGISARHVGAAMDQLHPTRITSGSAFSCPLYDTDDTFTVCTMSDNGEVALVCVDSRTQSLSLIFRTEPMSSVSSGVPRCLTPVLQNTSLVVSVGRGLCARELRDDAQPFLFASLDANIEVLHVCATPQGTDVVFGTDRGDVGRVGIDVVVDPSTQTSTVSFSRPKIVEAHDGRVVALARTSCGDSDLLVSTSFDCTAKVLRLPELQALTTLRGHCDAVVSVALHPMLSMITTCDVAGAVRAWAVDGSLLTAWRATIAAERDATPDRRGGQRSMNRSPTRSGTGGAYPKPGLVAALQRGALLALCVSRRSAPTLKRYVVAARTINAHCPPWAEVQLCRWGSPNRSISPAVTSPPARQRHHVVQPRSAEAKPKSPAPMPVVKRRPGYTVRVLEEPRAASPYSHGEAAEAPPPQSSSAEDTDGHQPRPYAVQHHDRQASPPLAAHRERSPEPLAQAPLPFEATRVPPMGASSSEDAPLPRVLAAKLQKNMMHLERLGLGPFDCAWTSIGATSRPAAAAQELVAPRASAADAWWEALRQLQELVSGNASKAGVDVTPAPLLRRYQQGMSQESLGERTGGSPTRSRLSDSWQGPSDVAVTLDLARRAASVLSRFASDELKAISGMQLGTSAARSAVARLLFPTVVSLPCGLAMGDAAVEAFTRLSAAVWSDVLSVYGPHVGPARGVAFQASRVFGGAATAAPWGPGEVVMVGADGALVNSGGRPITAMASWQDARDRVATLGGHSADVVLFVFVVASCGRTKGVTIDSEAVGGPCATITGVLGPLTAFPSGTMFRVASFNTHDPSPVAPHMNEPSMIQWLRECRARIIILREDSLPTG